MTGNWLWLLVKDRCFEFPRDVHTLIVSVKRLKALLTKFSAVIIKLLYRKNCIRLSSVV